MCVCVKIVTEERIHTTFYFPLSSLLTPSQRSQPLPYYGRISIIWYCRREMHQKIESRIKSDEHKHLSWCEQLITYKFPHCAPAKLETSCILQIGDASWKLWLRCSWRCLRFAHVLRAGIGDIVAGPYLLPDMLTARGRRDFTASVPPMQLEDSSLVVRQRLRFQSDGATAHYGEDIWQRENATYPGRCTWCRGPILCPSRSPGLRRI
jgi:hypothetical protein